MALTDLEIELDGLAFEAGKSIRYHSYRRAWWLAWDHWSKIFAIVTGAGVVVSSFSTDSFWIRAFAIVTAIASAGDVVFGFGTRALAHEKLYRDWSRFRQDVLLCFGSACTSEAVARFRARRVEIEQDEPDHLDRLERRCAAEEAQALGRPVNPVWRLTTWQNLFAQWSLLPSSFKRIS